MYLLDTNVIIAVLRGEKKLLLHLAELNVPQFYMSAVTYFEILVGAEKETISVEELETYLELFAVLPLTKEIAARAATLSLNIGKRKVLHKDLLIAASADVHKMTVVTHDREFAKVKGPKMMVMAK